MTRLAAVVLALAAGCSSTPAGNSDGGGGGGGGLSPTAWANPMRVTITGWTDTAMEPFISRDGLTLFFNNSNDPSVDTDLHYATRVDDLTFDYAGPLAGANSTGTLDAVASEDDDGTFYFITTRSYAASLTTLYRGTFYMGNVIGITVETGLPASAAGHVIFDAAVSPDGATLAFAEGDYTTGSLTAAALGLAARDTAGNFHRIPTSDTTLGAINSGATIQYAPVFSASLLELYYTRIESNGVPAIYVATRDTSDAPFGAPQKLDAITGFAEAPTLSVDEKSLYYHHLDGTTFVIYRVTR